MIPGLGEKYDIQIETITRPREEYQSLEYSQLNLTKAPAIMLEEVLVVEGADISQNKLEAAICQHLGISPRIPSQNGIFGRLSNR